MTGTKTVGRLLLLNSPTLKSTFGYELEYIWGSRPVGIKALYCTPEINITRYVNSTGMKIKNLLPEGKHVTLRARCHNHLGTHGQDLTWFSCGIFCGRSPEDNSTRVH